MKRSFKNSKKSAYESVPPPLNIPCPSTVTAKDVNMLTSASGLMSCVMGNGSADLDPDPDPPPLATHDKTEYCFSGDARRKNKNFKQQKLGQDNDSCEPTYFVNSNFKEDSSSSKSSKNNSIIIKLENQQLAFDILNNNDDKEEDIDGVDDDGNNENCPSDSISINSSSCINNNNIINEINEKKKEDDNNINNNNEVNKQEKLRRNSFTERFNKDFDGQVEIIADMATKIMSRGSFYNCGLYQIISFLFVSIAWTVGNGWYAYVSVFSGYTPEHECDVNAMGPNFTVNSNDTKCSAIDMLTNTEVKCTKWTYDKSQMVSTIVTEFDFVCDKDYYFELAYSVEQIGYVIGTLIFSYLADVIGRKPVMVIVLVSMSVTGLVQQFVTNFWLFMSMGLIINSLACGLEAVCVTLVLEMFSTSKRTFFGIGIEVVWVIVLACMSPLAYVIKTWREIRLVIFIVLSVLAITSFWWCQESVRWLISMSKTDEALKIIDRIVKYNKLEKRAEKKFKRKQSLFESQKESLNILLHDLKDYNKMNGDSGLSLVNAELDSTQTVSSLSSSSRSSGNFDDATVVVVNKRRSNDRIIDMIKNSKFRLYVLIMALNWFATALVYDGLTYLNNYIGENIYINWVVMNLIELPAQFVCYLVISRYGRRLTTSVTLILAGVILLASMIEMLEFVEKMVWIKLVIFVLAKFIITQSYSSVILHAPELFPTNLRSFGYGICLFSGKITSLFSPMISIYLSKIMPRLPAIIYGIISISCGIISLYVPETLNRPLPNSIDDVVKWPRSLSKQEKKRVKKLNKEELNSIYRAVFRSCLNKLALSKRFSKKQKQPTQEKNIKLNHPTFDCFIQVGTLNEFNNNNKNASLLLLELKKSQFIIKSDEKINNTNIESNQSSSLSSSSSSNSLSNTSSN